MRSCDEARSILHPETMDGPSPRAKPEEKELLLVVNPCLTVHCFGNDRAARTLSACPFLPLALFKFLHPAAGRTSWQFGNLSPPFQQTTDQQHMTSGCALIAANRNLDSFVGGRRPALT